MIQQAVGALQSGNSFQARGLFEKIVTFPEADPTAWLGLAFACAHQGDAEAALAAVDKLLELEPDNLRGNIFKGDHLQHMGNTRGALQFYQAALRLAAGAGAAPREGNQDDAAGNHGCQRGGHPPGVIAPSALRHDDLEGSTRHIACPK